MRNVIKCSYSHPVPCQRHISPPLSEGVFSGLVLGMAGCPHDKEAQIVEQICTSPRNETFTLLSCYNCFITFSLISVSVQLLNGQVEARALFDEILGPIKTVCMVRRL